MFDKIPELRHNLNMLDFTFAIVAAFAFTLFLLERKFALRGTKAKLGQRLLVNFGMALLTFLIAMALVRPASLGFINMADVQKIGLLNTFQAPEWVKAVLTFLLLDLSFYYWHRLNHAWPFLWRFHNVHHIDPDLDVSTAFRFHFAEVALSTIFRIVQALLIGPALVFFLAYELVFQFSTFFHHSNLRLPRRLEKALMLVFVTPRMHGIHHSNFKDETNSNYSVVFSFWDRIHRSFENRTGQNDITIGVPGYSEPEDNRFMNVLSAPFKKQRDYWRGREQRPRPW